MGNDVRYFSTPQLDNRNAVRIDIIEPSKKSSFAGSEGIGRYHLVGHSLGIAGGIYYSFVKKTGFWKGLGITLIFGIAGGALGMAVDYATKKNDK